MHSHIQHQLQLLDFVMAEKMDNLMDQKMVVLMAEAKAVHVTTDMKLVSKGERLAEKMV